MLLVSLSSSLAWGQKGPIGASSLRSRSLEGKLAEKNYLKYSSTVKKVKAQL